MTVRCRSRTSHSTSSSRTAGERSGSSSSACLAPQALELDPDRSPAVLELEVLCDVLDRHLTVIPHATDVGELLSNVGQAFLRLFRGEAFLELAERTLHQRCLLYTSPSPRD